MSLTKHPPEVVFNGDSFLNYTNKKDRLTDNETVIDLENREVVASLLKGFLNIYFEEDEDPIWLPRDELDELESIVNNFKSVIENTIANEATTLHTAKGIFHLLNDEKFEAFKTSNYMINSIMTNKEDKNIIFSCNCRNNKRFRDLQKKRYNKLAAKHSHLTDKLRDKTTELDLTKKENQRLKQELKILQSRVEKNITLTDYGIFDKYICDTVEQHTGRKRDFYNGVKNNITDFLRIETVGEIIKKDFNISVVEFIRVFKELKTHRIIAAHPVINRNMNKIKKRIKQVINNQV